MAFGWIGVTSAFASAVRKANMSALTLPSLALRPLSVEHDVALELANGRQQVEHQLPGRRRGVEVHGEDAQRHALRG